MQIDLKKYNTNRLILLGIILVASFLRLYNFVDLPFSHDEYSAIIRTQYSNFNDLIKHGVLPDFHPAGIQIFLYYWVKLVGTDTWIVKLPFVLTSISSVYLLYIISKKWTNETVGLITASFLATSQYAITYGTYARPYATGLFFTLLLVYALTHLIQQPNKKFWRNWILFVLAGTACAYNHYANMLIAGFIGLSSFFFIDKSIRWKYIIAGATIGIFYIPHISILSFHLSKGGIGGPDGWLGPPESTFFFEYISYLFHYSIFSIILIISIYLIGYLFGKRQPSFNANIDFKKRLYFFIAWFLLPFLICYFYSIYKNPIIQFSVLIPSHFLIYILLFGHIKPLKFLQNIIIVLLILSTNIATLIYVREHFYVHFKIDYNNALEQLETIRKKHPNIPALIDTDPRISNYLQKKWNREIHFDPYQFKNGTELITYLDSISRIDDYFYYVESNQVNNNNIQLIKRYFGTIEWQQYNQSDIIYLFSKAKKSSPIWMIYEWKPSSKLPKEWAGLKNENLFHSDENNSWVYQIDSLTEWGPSITFNLKDIVYSTKNVIDIEITTSTLSKENNFIVVSEIKDQDSLLFWGGTNSSDQLTNSQTSTISHSFTVPKDKFITDNNLLNVNFWNQGKKNVLIKEVKITLREGNPYRYSLFYPIKKTVISDLKGLQLQGISQR